VNKPSPIEPAETLIFVTPLCAARMKRHREIEAVLLRHGAKGDIFTHAFLGDLEALREDLARAPSSAQASDPASTPSRSRLFIMPWLAATSKHCAGSLLARRRRTSPFAAASARSLWR
jgi:hypothetical protein